MHQLSLLKLRSWHKTSIVIFFDFVVALLSFSLAQCVRFGEIFPDIFNHKDFIMVLLITCLIQSFVFYLSNLYKAIWRFFSTPDLIRILKAVAIAVPLSFVGVFLFNRLEAIPRSTFIIDSLFLFLGISGGRLLYRMLSDGLPFRHRDSSSTRVIIIGAGRAGQAIIRDIKQNPSLNMQIVAVIDDDYGKRGKLLHGIEVKGGVPDLPQIAQGTSATKAFIAIPSASSESIRKIIDQCKDTGMEIKILPKISDIIHGQVEFSQLRNVGPEDLLGRKPVMLDLESMGELIAGKIVLITGAGGSIGSELSKQICRLKPKHIILFELTELFLYELEMELNETFPHLSYSAIIGDVRSVEHVNSIFLNFSPQVIFHAAAYKHVPMMEKNPLEAITTNIFGTQNVALHATQYKAEKFVLVSTDKAINPTNIMGASKRIAELVCQYQQTSAETKFITLRFGNVLGSSGSVIPLFKKQIERGGPVTVTHPDITRYFMSIAEATQLVIQAGAFGNGGEIFVLDMGDPIKIDDLAREMITLSGLRIDEDISIEYTGLRPGEKLYEELFDSEESTLKTAHPMVRVAKTREIVNLEIFEKKLLFLTNLTRNTSLDTIKNCFQDLVPEYNHNPTQNNSTNEEQLSH